MTNDQGVARQTAGLFIGAWVLLALAIADLPPPPGFVFAVLILLACAVAIYLRLPTYLRWQATSATGRMLRVARDGFLGGGAIARRNRGHEAKSGPDQNGTDLSTARRAAPRNILIRWENMWAGRPEW